MQFWAKTLRASLLAATLLTPAVSAANGVSGDYLAARQASFIGDFKAAARHYGRAIQFDPTNPQLLERGVLANVALGDVERAAGLADKLAQEGYESSLAQMSTVSRDAKAENYSAVLDAIEQKRGVGPLADGLVKAWAQLGQGDMTSALVDFDEVTKQQGLGPFATYHKAMALASVGDFESAEALFTGGAMGGMSMTRRGVMAHSEILSQLGRNEDALALIDAAFGKNLDPGLTKLRASLEADERVSFSHVRSARDGIAEVFYSLGGALSAEDNDDLTLIYSRLAEYLRPDHVDATLLSGDLLDKMEQYDLAVAAYARVPADSTSAHAAELGRAEALRKQGNLETAVEVLKGLTLTHGDLPVVHSTLADLLRQMERYSAAVDSYTEALGLYEEITERQWFLYYARAISFERQDMWEEAEADFRSALELNPDQPQVLNYLGYSLVEKQIKLDEALDMIERAVAARPDSGYIVDSLGWVLYRLGRYEEAVPHMERAAELMPIDPIVNDHLGDVYWSVGRTLEAEFQWKRALSFVDWEDAAEEADPERIRRKLEVGLDQVLSEEGAAPLREANAAD
ncbi:tetratricopeptide repeat protein [Thalassococcus lentus]|uniref:Tetratricopeptide repeat protein n=1 Tax=Thalassococcus lentus TaxID=1210524 RepID=A0ABT4XSQ1_9RHOB|nr:tetratricopeptide repeat protein [Thalassococcus lentus]MDA7424986.1 tetratricopeptide repeat protein [Thalassococcus lentus]